MGIIARSFDRVKQHIEPHLGIIPVIKGNAYGIGTEKIAEFLLPRCRDMMACAQVLEADSIRRSGTDCEILILGGIPAHALDKAVELDLQVPVFNPEGAQALSDASKKLGKRAKAHIKIETGLGRIGAKPGEELEKLTNTLSALDNVDIDGVFTHFATATIVQSEYTLHQLEIFKQAIALLLPSACPIWRTAIISWTPAGSPPTRAVTFALRVLTPCLATTSCTTGPFSCVIKTESRVPCPSPLLFPPLWERTGRAPRASGVRTSRAAETFPSFAPSFASPTSRTLSARSSA